MFIEQIKFVCVTHKRLISFDVISLLKNIPSSEAVVIETNLIL